MNTTRLKIVTYQGIGYSTHTELHIDEQLVGHHIADHMLQTHYGGESWYVEPGSTIKIKPAWNHLFGHSACYLSECLKAAEEYIATTDQ